MPPRRRAAAAPLDVELTRQKLAEGKIVRVGISRSAQFPDGTVGRVRSVGDPAVDGEEFIQVELSLGGTRDVLPFTPADLTPATRGRPPADAAPPTGPAGSTSRRTIPASPVRLPAPPGPAVGAGPAGPVGPTPDGSASSGPLVTAGPVSPAGSRPPPSAHPTGSSVRPPAKGPRTGKRPPAVVITIASTDSEPQAWRIEAKVGTRVALRAGAVTPARVWELVQLLENETLTKAVGAILTEQRSAAQARAATLAAELAAVRAELDALPNADPG